jgi:type I restriction enzyme S subunit
MTALRSGWTWRTLGEIAEVVGGVTKDTKKQADPRNVEVPYLRVANVQRGRLDLSNVATIRVPAETAKRLELRRGDVLLNEGGDRDKLGRGWVWDDQIPRCIHQNHVFRARLRDNVEPKFLAYYTNELGRDWFEHNGRQTTNLASISLTKIRQLPVPVPSVDEQRRIVEILEDHLSRVDAGVRGLDSSTKRLKMLTKSVLLGLVSKPVPPGWTMTTVGEAGRVDLGRQRHPDWHHGPEMRPYLRVANVFEDRIDTSDVMQMDFFGVFDRYRLVPGDVLLNEGQSPELLGRPAIYRGDPPGVAFTNTLLRFRAHEDVLSEWALLVFRAHMHSGRFAKESRITTNIAHLSAARLKSVEFPKPPIQEQRRLVHQTAERLAEVSRLEQEILTAKKRQLALRRALLQAAFEGRLTDRLIKVDEIEEMIGV